MEKLPTIKFDKKNMLKELGKEINEEYKTKIKEKVKDKMKEIRMTEILLEKQKKQLEAMLNGDSKFTEEELLFE